jgi:hypothetical protein
VDVEHRSIRPFALHIPQPPHDLNGQPGLLGHLPDHCTLIGLAALDPTARH